MRYILGFLLIFLLSIYTMSFAKYSWNNDNKLAAIGAILLIFLSFGVCFLVYLKT